MSTPHDPRCPVKVWTTVNGEAERGCECGLIAKVRADEATNTWAKAGEAGCEALLTDLRAKVKAMAAQDLGPAATPTQVGYDAGRANALSEILALLPEVSE